MPNIFFHKNRMLRLKTYISSRYLEIFNVQQKKTILKFGCQTFLCRTQKKISHFHCLTSKKPQILKHQKKFLYYLCKRKLVSPLFHPVFHLISLRMILESLFFLSSLFQVFLHVSNKRFDRFQLRQMKYLNILNPYRDQIYQLCVKKCEMNFELFE